MVAKVKESGPPAQPPGEWHHACNGAPGAGRGSSLSAGTAVRINSPGEAEALARRVLDPDRTRPIICVTTPAWSQHPHVDMEVLAEAVGEHADITLMPTGDETWALSARLPERLDVYGGAARLWWPMGRETPVAEEHPLMFAWGEKDSKKIIARIRDEFARAGIELPGARNVKTGDELAGVVRHVGIDRAEIETSDGDTLVAHSSRLTKASGLRPNQVLRAGQGVRIKVEADGQASLLPFEAEPWARVLDQLEVGMVVEGVVKDFRNFGAFITILPGHEGLVHRSQISDEWVSHPEDFLELGKRVVVKVIRVDRASRKVELSIKAVKAGESAVALSILPDGPGWLDTEPAPAVDIDDVGAPVEEVVAEPAAEEDPAASSEYTPRKPLSDALGEPAAAAVPEDPPAPVDPQPEVPSRMAEVEELEAVIGAAAEVPAELEVQVSATEKRVRELRAEAASIVRGLQSELAETRLRMLKFAEEETKGLIGSTEAALEEARAAAEELRLELAAVEADRTQLLERFEQERNRASSAELRGREARERLEREVGDRREVEQSFDRALGGAEGRFLRELKMAWEDSTSEGDRPAYPWREPVLGNEFMNSLETVEGIARGRVLEVCAHVVSGRAPEIPSLEVHALRSGMGGEDAQRLRPDGSKAFRASLQVKAAAARRLHYWQLPDGRIELARVVYHDDFSI